MIAFSVSLRPTEVTAIGRERFARVLEPWDFGIGTIVIGRQTSGIEQRLKDSFMTVVNASVKGPVPYFNRHGERQSGPEEENVFTPLNNLKMSSVENGAKSGEQLVE